MGPLFAAIPEWVQWIAVVLLPLIGGATQYGLGKWVELRQQRKVQFDADETKAVARVEAVLSRVDQERVELREVNRKLEQHALDLLSALQQVRIEATRAVDWIRYQEDLLARATPPIPHRKWDMRDDGSDTHTPLPKSPEGNPPVG